MPAFSQSCPVMPTDGSSQAYRYRDNVPRCEGTLTQMVANTSAVSLISFTFGEVRYRLSTDRMLQISLPSPTEDLTRIRGVNLQARKYYRLDVNLPAGRNAIQIPLQDVLGQLRFEQDHLGVFGERDLSPTVVGYVPLRAAAPGTEPGTTLRVVIRPNIEVTAMKWRLSASGAQPTAWQDVPGAQGRVPLGTALPIELGNDLPGPRCLLELAYSVGGAPQDLPTEFVLLKP